MTAGFYDDDFFREYWKNQEAFKSLQKMIDDTMAPALAAIRQSAGITALQKQMAAAVLPAIDMSTFNAMKAFAASMPVIEVPKMPHLTFGNITQLKLGDDVAQKFMGSVDVDELSKSAAPPTDHEPANVPEPASPEPVGLPEVDPKNIKEADLDRYLDVLYLAHPNLPAELENDPELSKLDDYQKKIFCWLLSIMVMCGMSVLHTWGTYDENIANVTAVVEQVDGGISGSGDIKNVMLRKEDEPIAGQEAEDE